MSAASHLGAAMREAELARECPIAWSPVDDETADLLSLVADDGHPSADFEWEFFVRSLRFAATADDGLVQPNTLRALVRGNVAPRRIGAFTHRALSQGLVEYTGNWQVSDDTQGRNGGKPARVMRWIGAQVAKGGAA